VKTNKGRLANGALVGLMFAVIVRGALGCGAEEAEQTGMQAQPPGEQVAEVVQTSGPAVPDGIIDLENTVCPVMGNPVREGVYVDWEGYRVHFCCAGCDDAFLSDPETYLDILAGDPDVAEKLGRGAESE
jgi:hypothetical protein